MSRAKGGPAQQCWGKIPYPNLGDARYQLGRIKRQHGATRQRVYKCQYCSYYHIGNKRPPHAPRTPAPPTLDT